VLDFARRIGKLVAVNQGECMKHLAVALAAASLFAWCNAACAEEIDLSTWTCKKFQAADKDEIGIILAWLDGYYREESDPPVIDTEKFVANAKKLGAYCGEHPDIGLITATDKLFNKKN
jgi:acid stress chaperone HdeB